MRSLKPISFLFSLCLNSSFKTSPYFSSHSPKSLSHSIIYSPFQHFETKKNNFSSSGNTFRNSIINEITSPKNESSSSSSSSIVEGKIQVRLNPPSCSYKNSVPVIKMRTKNGMFYIENQWTETEKNKEEEDPNNNKKRWAIYSYDFTKFPSKNNIPLGWINIPNNLSIWDVCNVPTNISSTTTTTTTTLELEMIEPNQKFIEEIHKFLKEYVYQDPLLIQSAKKIENGWMHVSDHRAPVSPRRSPDPQDIFGSIEVKDGKMIQGSYTENSVYRLITSSHSFLQFSPHLSSLFTSSFISSSHSSSSSSSFSE